MLVILSAKRLDTLDGAQDFLCHAPSPGIPFLLHCGEETIDLISTINLKYN